MLYHGDCVSSYHHICVVLTREIMLSLFLCSLLNGLKNYSCSNLKSVITLHVDLTAKVYGLHKAEQYITCLLQALVSESILIIYAIFCTCSL